MIQDGVTKTGRVFAMMAACATLFPLPVVLCVALSENWRNGPFGGLTLTWVTDAWEKVSANLMISVKLAIVALIVDALLAFPAAYLLARYRFPGRSLLASLTNAPIAIPGIAIGLALVIAYPVLKPPGWLMFAGHVLYTLPFLLAALLPAMSRRDLVEQEQVAASFGSSPLRTFFTITLPAVRRAAIGGLLMVFALSFGEFNVTAFLYVPTQQPMPIVLFDAYITGRLESAAAATVIFLAIIIPPILVLERMGGARVTGA